MNLLTKSLVSAALVVLLSFPSLADNKEEEGEKLVRHAEQISDIRSADAPGFRLTASFKLVGADAPTTEGKYSEIWLSAEKWQRETMIGNFQRLEVGAGKTRWVLDSTQEIPGRAGELATLMHVGGVVQGSIKASAIRGQTIETVPARCIDLKGGGMGKQTLCVDSATGVLLRKNTPTLWMNRRSEYLCEYGEYQPFGDRLYPHHIRCTDDRHTGIDVKVVELATGASADPSLFIPPSGAEELANCSGKVLPPKPLQTPDPQYPKGEPQPNNPVVVRIAVGTDGMPHRLRIARTAGNAFDNRALEAVQRWVFKPAMCDGEAVPVEINVEITFRSR